MIQRLFILLVSSLIGASILSATEHNGSVRAADQYVPGATIIATQDTNKVTAYTDESGRYVMDLGPGDWSLEVKVFGFTAVHKQLSVGSDPTTIQWTIEMPRPDEPGGAAAATASSTASATSPTPATPANPATPNAVARNRAGGRGQGRGGQPGQPGQGRGGAQQQAAAGRGQQAAPQGFQSVGVAATADGQDALAAAASQGAAAFGDLSNLQAEDAFAINGSTSGGLGASADQENQRQRLQNQNGGRGGQGGVGGNNSLASLGLPPGMSPLDNLGLGGLGADAFNAGFTDGLGGGGPQNAGGGRGGRGGGGPGGNAGGGGGGGGRGGGRGGGGGGGRGGRGGRGNNQFAAFGNRRNQQPRYNGQVNLNLTNSNLNASPFSLNGQAAPKPSTNTENISATFGGQLIIPKLVNLPRTQFTLTYSHSQSSGGGNSLGSVPTAAMRGGDFSQTLTGLPATTILYDPLSDPANRTPFMNNMIPLARIDKAASGLLALFPNPTYSGLIQNYRLITSSPSSSNNFGVRYQLPLTNKDRLNFNVQAQNRDSSSQQLFGYTDTSTGTGMSASTGWSHSFAARINNSATITFSRNNSETVPFFANTTNLAGQLGITGNSQIPVNYGPPTVSFTNFSSLSDGSASIPRSQTVNMSDTFTYVLKRVHNLQFGGGYVRQQQNSDTNSNARGSFSFSGLSTSLLNANGQPLAGTGYDFADFLLGLPASSRISGPTNDYYRGWYTNAYVQDDYRVTRNLSINFGIRYDYFNPWTEKYGQIANLDLAPNYTAATVITPGQIAPYSGSLPPSLLRGQDKNLSPRLGLAWRPSQKDSLVIRTGYSRVYSGSPYQQLVTKMGGQPPFARQVAVSTSAAELLTLENGFPTVPNQLTNTFAIDPNYKLPDAQSWNLAIQHNLPGNLLVEVEYQGIKGTHLGVVEQPNRAAAGATQLTSQQQLLIGNATGYNYQTDGANSSFQAGQVRLTRRFSRGMSATLLYIYSKSIDNASSVGGIGGTAVEYIYNWNLERGLASTDQRNRVTLTYQLTSPIGASARALRNGGWKMHALAGWTLQGQFSAMDGTPLTATVAGNAANTGGVGALGGTIRADATGLPITGGANPYFNTLAFTTPAPGQFGNAGNGTIPGLFRTTLSATLNRSFRLGEGRKQLQLRLSANNALNHVAITSFGTTVGSSTYGIATGATATRTVQLQMRFQF